MSSRKRKTGRLPTLRGTVGERFKQLRDHAGLSILETAVWTAMTDNLISDIESGTVPAGSEARYRLQELFDIGIMDFSENTDSGNQQV